MTCLPAKSIDTAFAHHRAGEFDEAEALYRSALAHEPDNLSALQLLGLLLHAQGRSADAVDLLERAVAVASRRGDRSPNYAVLHNNLGNALRGGGRWAEATAHYRRGIELDPHLPELHENLGNALLDESNAAGAIVSYEQARRLGRIMPTALCRLAAAYAAVGNFAEAQARYREANTAFIESGQIPPDDALEALAALARILLDSRKAGDAIEVCRRLVVDSPDDADTHYLFGRAQRDLGDNGAAINAFRRCLELDPDTIAALHDLGVLLAAVGLKSVAVPFLERATALQPDHVSSHVELGNLLHSLGDTERAFTCFQRACELRPLTTWAAQKQPATFSALAVTSPGIGNTPPYFLFGQAAFDCHFFALLPDISPDIDALRAHGDIAINLICDVDQGREILLAAADLFDRLGKPTINHPRKVLSTGRDAIAKLLSGLPGCHAPPAIRCSRARLETPDALDWLQHNRIVFPLLLRVVGTHGGDAFERMCSADDVAAFLAQHSADAFYATAYVDYQSDDGYFRKYRFIFINDEILPYHLAIADHWKVHHFRTDMSRHAWMKNEEKFFLEDPGRVFSAANFGTLRQIQAAVGLEFFGIDCSLDRAGNLVVFEVNASMLIHDDNAEFPYKTPACVRIKDAFTAALAGRRTAGCF